VLSAVVILIVIVSLARGDAPAATAEGPPDPGLTPVVYRAGDGGLHALWPRPTGPWRTTDITADAGTPAALGSPFLYRTDVDGARTLRVVYRGTDNHVHELRMTPTGRWEHTDLSAQAQATGVVPAVGDPFAYLTDQGGVRVARVIYRGADDHMHQIRLVSGQWLGADIGALGGAPPAAGDPFAYTTTDDGTQTFRIVYRGTDSHIHELRLPAGGAWQTIDISSPAQAAPAGGDPGAYTTTSGETTTRHVVYQGADGRVHELRSSGTSWTDAVISTGNPCPAALAGSVIESR
jgi:hypothetical protein